MLEWELVKLLLDAGMGIIVNSPECWNGNYLNFSWMLELELLKMFIADEMVFLVLLLIVGVEITKLFLTLGI